MAIQHAKDSNFKEMVQTEGITVVNFWAAWCGPCRMFAPVLEEFEKEAKDSIKVVKVTVSRYNRIGNKELSKFSVLLL